METENSNDLAQRSGGALAPADLAKAFGGPEAAAPIEFALPEIKMSKEDSFEMPDDSKATEIVGHIVYAQRARAYFSQPYNGENVQPDCASSNCIAPDSDGDWQAERCSECDMARWVKDDDGKNSMPCAPSLNIILLIDNKSLPCYMRVRSTSIGKKSSLAKFFMNSLDPAYALAGKFQTVKVKLVLEETKINNFKTSLLIVEKVGVLAEDDPLLPTLVDLYSKAQDEFVVTHTRGDEAEEANLHVDAKEEAAVRDGTYAEDYDDDAPI